MDNNLSSYYSAEGENPRAISNVVADTPNFAPPPGVMVCGLTLRAAEDGGLHEDLLDSLVSFGLLALSSRNLMEHCEPVLELSAALDIDFEYLVFLATNCKFSVALLPSDDEVRWKTVAKRLYKKALETPQFAGNVYPMAVASEILILESVGAAEPAELLRKSVRGEAELDLLHPSTARYEYARLLAGTHCLQWAEEVANEVMTEHFGEGALPLIAQSVAQGCAESVKHLRAAVLKELS